MMVCYSFQSAKRYTGYTVGAILISILSMTTNGKLDGLHKVAMAYHEVLGWMDWLL